MPDHTMNGLKIFIGLFAGQLLAFLGTCVNLRARVCPEFEQSHKKWTAATSTAQPSLGREFERAEMELSRIRYAKTTEWHVAIRNVRIHFWFELVGTKTNLC